MSAQGTQGIRRLISRTVVLPMDDVDTDQIIPARFLTTTSRDGLGRHLFHDWRYRADGTENPDFVLNSPQAKDCEILVAGHNFGCGSSREHAPWALLDYGIKAVVSTEVADIFRSNALKNGLLPILVTPEVHEHLMQNAGDEISVDLETTRLTLADGRSFDFPLDGFARYCLLEGIDQLGFLHSRLADIFKFEEDRAWTP